MDFLKIDSNILLTIFYVWANIIAITIILIIFHKNMKHKQTRSRCLSMVMFHLIIYFIGDSIWAFAYFKVFGENEVVLRMSRMIYYGASNMIAFAWLMYVELVLNPNMNYNRVRKILLVPTLLSLVGTVVICSFLNPAEKSIYGYLTAFLIILVPFTYIIGSGVHVLISFKKANIAREKIKLLQFAIRPLVIIIFSVLQVFIAEITNLLLRSDTSYSIFIHSKSGFIYYNRHINWCL